MLWHATFLHLVLTTAVVFAAVQSEMKVDSWRVATAPPPAGLSISCHDVELVAKDSLNGLLPGNAEVENHVEDNRLITSGVAPFGKSGRIHFTRTVSVRNNCAKIVLEYEVSPQMKLPDGNKEPEHEFLDVNYEISFTLASLSKRPYRFSAYATRKGLMAIGTLDESPLELWGTEFAIKDVAGLGTVEVNLSNAESADTCRRGGGGWRFRYRPQGEISVWTKCRGSELGWRGRFECQITTHALFETKDYVRYKNEMSKPIGLESFDRYPEFRKRIYLNGTWRTRGFKEKEIDNGLEKGYYKADTDSNGWVEKDFPILEDKDEGGNVAAWYRKEFHVPREAAGKRIILTFHKVNGKAQVWLNGQKVGEHENTFYVYRAYFKSVTDESFWFDVTDMIRPGQRNILTVHAVNVQGEYHPGEKQWGSHFGITQPVFYVVRPQVYFKNVFIASDLASKSMKLECIALNHTGKEVSVPVHAKVTPWNDPKAESCTVNLGTHRIAPGESTLKLILPLNNPVPWETDNPYLYVIELQGQFDNKYETMYVERTGFRTFEMRGNRFYLNGTPVFLRGLTEGEAQSFCFVDGLRRFLNGEDAVYNFIKILKDLNHNHIRFHTQLWPEVWYDISDELGMLVCNEFVQPKRELANPAEMRPDNIEEIDLKHMPETSRVMNTVRQWVTNLHNHPCSATWSGGNELHEFRWGGSVSELLAIIYDTIKSVDRQNRPITATSGGEIQGYKKPTKTDYLDNHIYIDYPWWSLDRLDPKIDEFRDRFRRLYKREAFPLVDGEFHGIHLNNGVPRQWTLFDSNGHISRKGYVQMVGAPRPDWFISRCRWHMQCAGVRMTTQRWEQDGVYEAARIPFEIRRTAGERLAGFEHFCTEMVTVYDWYNLRPLPGMDAFKKVLAPEFVCIKFPFRKHVFAGGIFEGDIWAVNDTRKDMPEVSVEAMLVHDGKEYGHQTLEIGMLPVGGRAVKQYRVVLGTDWPSGPWNMCVRMYTGKKAVAENTYRLHVEDKTVHASIKTTRNVLLHDVMGKVSPGQTTTAKVLKAYGVEYAPFKPEALDGAQVLIIGRNSLDDAVLKNAEKIREWLERGGRMVMFEQSCDGPLPFLPNFKMTSLLPYSYSDPIDEMNPALRGLDHQDFFLWNKSSLGTNVFQKMILPLNEGVVCSGATSTTSKPTIFGMTACEFKIGKGLCFISLLEATERFKEDSVATRYLRNLLEYVLGDDWDGSHAFPIGGGKLARFFSKEQVFFVDLRKHANRSFVGKQVDNNDR